MLVETAIGPVMPDFVRGLAQPQVWLSVGTGLFLGVQLVAAPLLGRLSDGYGRRPIFIVSAIGTLLATGLLLPVRAGVYFANRVSDGLTNGLYATARSAITDVSSPERLCRNQGLEGALISLGFVALDCTTLSLIPGLLDGRLARHTTEADRGEVFGLNQAFQSLASVATTVVFASLSVLDLRLPWTWFALCLAVVAGLAARPEPGVLLPCCRIG